MGDQQNAQQVLWNLKGPSQKGNRIHDKIKLRDPRGKLSKALYEPKRTRFRLSDLIYCLLPWKRKYKPKHLAASYTESFQITKFSFPSCIQLIMLTANYFIVESVHLYLK